MTKKTKDHLISGVLTFSVGFLMSITPFIDTLNVHNLELAAVIGLVSAGFRGGLKALIEWITGYLEARKIQK